MAVAIEYSIDLVTAIRIRIRDRSEVGACSHVNKQVLLSRVRLRLRLSIVPRYAK